MNNIRACRHCGSPAKGNPCWWSLKYPATGGDPPCFDEDYSERVMARERRFARIWLGIFLAAAGSVAALAYFFQR